MSQETKRWRGLVVGGVCAILALAGVYCLKSGETKPAPKQERSTKAHLEVPAPTPETPPPSTPAPPLPLPSQLGNTQASISGTVRFADSNEPASGTRVQIACTTFSLTTHADQCGSYTLTGLPPLTKMQITAEDKLADLYMLDSSITLVLPPGYNRTGVDLLLYKGRQNYISGKVLGVRVRLDTASLGSTEGKRVRLENFPTYEKKELLPFGGMTVQLRETYGKVEQKVVTNDAGDYEFRNLPAGRYLLELPPPMEEIRTNKEKFQFLINLKNEPKPNTNFLFRMGLQSISGRVTDTEGNPIRGVEVSIAETPNEMQVLKKTNNINPEDLLKEVWKRGDDRRPPQESRSKDRSEDRDEPLPPLKAITDNDGRYLLPNFSQLPFYWVAQYLTSGDNEIVFEICAQAKGYSAAHQKVKPFAENVVREGLEYLEFMAKTAGNMSEVPRVRKIPETDFPRSKGNLITDIDFVLQKGASISGYLVDSEGKAITEDGNLAIKKIKLVCTDKPTTTPQTQYAGVKSLSTDVNAEGRFEFPSAEAGNFRFKVQPEKMPLPLRTNPETLTVKTGDRIEDLRVEVEIPKLATLDITVLDAQTRQPIEWYYSSVLKGANQPGAKEKYNISSLDPSHKNGKAHFPSVPVGPAILVITTEMQYGAQSFDIEIQEGDNVLAPILLQSPGGIVGHVQDANSKQPIENYNIEIRQVHGILKKNESQPGEFEIMDISRGNTPRLEISAEGYAPLDLEVEVKAGQTTDLVIEMKPEGRLVGRITHEGGKQPGIYSVATLPAGKEIYYARQGETKEDGSYECRGLVEGENTVIATYTYYDPNGIRCSIRQYDPVQIKPGEEARKDFHFVPDAGISGGAKLPEEAQSVSLFVCNNHIGDFDPRKEPIIASVRTEQNEFPYEIRYLPAGTYQVFAFYRDKSRKEHWTPKKTITLQPGRIETVNITD
jgi:hypothetical protein